MESVRQSFSSKRHSLREKLNSWKQPKEPNRPQGPNSEPQRAGKLILITGASSDIAAHVLNGFLEFGYSVRGAVESQACADRIRKSYAKHGNRLSFVVVKDLAADHAFDYAAKGVDGVIHTWSPGIRKPMDNQNDILFPAINITISILQAVADHSPSVRRVILLSCFSAVVDLSKGLRPGYTYTEADWTRVTHPEAENGSAITAHCLGSKLIEETARRFVTMHDCNFRITTLCPSMIYGPNPHTVNRFDDLSASLNEFYRLIDGSLQRIPRTCFYAFVDVRDVATAHRLAFESDSNENQRYLITSGYYSLGMICDIICAEFPETEDRVPRESHQAEDPMQVYAVSNEKSVRELGMTYRPLRETVMDTVSDLLRIRDIMDHERRRRQREDVARRVEIIRAQEAAHVEPQQELQERPREELREERRANSEAEGPKPPDVTRVRFATHDDVRIIPSIGDLAMH